LLLFWWNNVTRILEVSMIRRIFFTVALSCLYATAALADGVMSLVGSEWGEGQGDGVMVKFEPGNKVWGRLGCNRFTGTYAQDGYKLTFGPLASTKMACPEPQMKTEMRVSAALTATSQADISHLKLVLQDGAGKILLTLQRRDFD
jgi:hypothetical protein